MNRLLILFLIILFSFSGCMENSFKKDSFYSQKKFDFDNLDVLLDSLKTRFEVLRPQVIKQPEGYFKYPYLIPGGFYTQMWDWDGFFMGNHFASIGKPEYLKHWALTLIQGVDEKGYVSGGATVSGPRVVFGKFAMKPFLSQGVYLASEALGDYSWTEEHYEALKRVIAYREETQMDSTYGLFFWDNGMQSGADNNVAMNYFKEDKRSYLAPDICTFQLREYLAQAIIARKLGNEADANLYREKAKILKRKINDILWDDEDKIYYTVDRETGEFYKRISYSSFVPLIQKIPSKADAIQMIFRYLVEEDHMKGEFGYRSLSLQDPDYNNKNIIVPFSNWQGPVWPIANYIYAIGLKHYGFDDDLEWLAKTLGNLMLNDIREFGTMHENYHADAGVPLAPAADHVDENGKFVGFISWNLTIQNLLEGVVEDKWMLLEVE